MAKAESTKKRITFYVEEDLLNDFLNIVYWSRKSQTTAINEAVGEYIETWKANKENKQYLTSGKIKQRPEGE